MWSRLVCILYCWLKFLFLFLFKKPLKSPQCTVFRCTYICHSMWEHLYFFPFVTIHTYCCLAFCPNSPLGFKVFFPSAGLQKASALCIHLTPVDSDTCRDASFWLMVLVGFQPLKTISGFFCLKGRFVFAELLVCIWLKLLTLRTIHWSIEFGTSFSLLIKSLQCF